jgi:peptidoglycan/xylan/chitin deacetylase (PgdA/CDA1 family)
LVQAPFGKLGREIVAADHRHDLDTVLWTVDPQDWREVASAVEISRLVLRRIRPGSIVLLHPGLRETPEAVCLILEGLARLGLRSVRLRDLAGAISTNHTPHARTDR